MGCEKESVKKHSQQIVCEPHQLHSILKLPVKENEVNFTD